MKAANYCSRTCKFSVTTQQCVRSVRCLLLLWTAISLNDSSAQSSRNKHLVLIQECQVLLPGLFKEKEKEDDCRGLEDWHLLSCSCSGSGQTGSAVVTDSDVTQHITNSGPRLSATPHSHSNHQQPQGLGSSSRYIHVHSVTSDTKPLPEEEKMVTSIHLLSNKCRLHNKDKMSLLLKSSFYLV